jgi:hypothetical protein
VRHAKEVDHHPGHGASNRSNEKSLEHYRNGGSAAG